MQNQLRMAKGAITNLQEWITRLQTELFLAKQIQNKQDRDFSQLKSKEGQLSELQAQLKSKEKQLKSTEEQLSQNIEELEEEKSKYDTENVMHKFCRATKSDALEEIRTLKEKLKSSEKSLACARHKQEHATNQLKQEREACFKNVDDLRDMHIQFEGLKGKLENTESERDVIQNILWQIEDDKLNLQKQLQSPMLEQMQSSVSLKLHNKSWLVPKARSRHSKLLKHDCIVHYIQPICN